MLFAIAAAVFVLDRITKYYARFWLQGQDPVPVIPGIIRFTYVENYGAAFGLLQHQRWLFVVVGVIVVVGILTYARQLERSELLQRAALGLLLGGALGNLIDRAMRGYVVDFVEFPYWPVFNVADSALVVGVSVMAIIMYRELSQEHQEQAEEDLPPGEETTEVSPE